MLDTASWQELTLRVRDELHLDTRNIRLENWNAQVEADVIEDLFANEAVLDLVQGIASIGYLTHELPVVVIRDGRFVVVEGNRRLAALKAIQNPNIVPDFQARVAALSSKIGDARSSLEKIRVTVAPSQDEADQLIAAIHTGNLRRKWSPARQADFFQAQLAAGRSFSDLVTRYPTIDVRRFVLRAKLLLLFRETVKGDPELEDYLTSKSWKSGLSALARIYESKAFVDFAGLRLTDDGDLETVLLEPVLGSVVRIIVAGLRDGSITTRSINKVTSPRFVSLMAELNALKVPSPSGAPGPGAPHPKGPGEAPTPSPTPSPRPGSRSRGGRGTGQNSRFLDLGDLSCPPAFPKAVSLLLQELSILDVERFPNTAFLAIRAVLEKATKSYADSQSVDLRARGFCNKNGHVQLRNTMDWLLLNFEKNGPRDLVQPTKGLRDGLLVNYTLTADALNAINHNHKFSVAPYDVHAMWDSVDPIFREILK